ncbi:putative disease resistance protein RGA3 isoform X2 [Lolium rigidum]|uniref:putative disease resistance protein RGA3 isoform X2 n=1 Tax=Lolium rigidum TaxID=89674 RepID=UPI001F5E215C|nr:putative disease resistance protein RGA3 isoform X2 [Lolium rigidum]
MALAFAGKAVAVSAISAIVRKSFEYLEKYTKAEGMKSVKEKLERTLPQVQVVFDAIDMERVRDQSEALDAWLWQLRDAVEEAEDVLDEVEYYKLERKVKTRGNKASSSLYKCKWMFIQQFSTMLKVGTFKRMVDAMRKLAEVAATVERFVLLVDRFDPSSLRHICHQEIGNPRETSSFLVDEKILGRDTERDQVIEWLVKQGSDDIQNRDGCNVSTYAIVGIGGMGKTTLAQAVYNDHRVKQCFDHIMWVCVSSDFDVHGLARKIAQEMTGRGTDITCLNTLQEIIRRKLSLKKFLLVFDDVWNDERRSDWEKLVAPLKFGQKGSKILLTTRMQSVVNIFERVVGERTKSLILGGLDDNDLLALLNKHAFFGVNPDDHVNLQDIGKKIIKKLSGSPLAAKVLGGLLNNSMDSIYWNRMLKENISTIEHGNEGVMKILRLSYHHLPPHLQACFRYCSMFEEDYEFTKDYLVKLWMGSGLIQLSVDEDHTLEDVGEHYLGILARKSFFEIHSGDTSKMSNLGEFSHECYVIHDLLHELGRTMSKTECINISSCYYGSIPRTVRHAIITVENRRVFTDFSALNKLRTLLISFDETIKKRDQWVALQKVLKVATKLRVLGVNRSSLLKLPDAFGNLMHLRYLHHRGPLKKVARYSFWCPCSIYKLYHLQMLRVYRCLLVSWRLGNLVSLRYPDFSGQIIGDPTFIGHLTSLQHLHFDVPHRYGFLARELEHLKGLRHLYASGLENVNAREATLAKLGEKENLIMLSLTWQSSQLEADREERVLNSLQPHTNLAKLKIEGYSGMKSPYWMENPMLTNLTYISLACCNNWQHLPPLGRLPSLKYLYLRDMNAVRRIEESFYGCEVTFAFPSLKLLSIVRFPLLEEWVEVEGMIMFRRLEQLCISQCSVLRNIPALPSTLAYLEIIDVGLSTLPATYHSCETTVSQKPLCSRLKI